MGRAEPRNKKYRMACFHIQTKEALAIGSPEKMSKSKKNVIDPDKF